MSIAVALILTTLTFIFVFYPFFKQKPRLAGTAGHDKLEELRSERDITYSMLKELEFDYQSGILTEEDYKELEARYKRKAISTLRNIDNAARVGVHDEAEPDETDEIEEQVRQLRRRKPAPAQPAATTAPKKAPANSGRKFCHECGQPVDSNDKFCASCGTKLDTRSGNG